ncbi:hypothetical protein BH10CHL1_BH10CHL1_25300 [soil metagenome]
MAIANCIECDEEVEINGRLTLGKKVTCSSCGAELEVASINPLELDWAEEEYEENWDDDFSDDEDDEENDDDLDAEEDDDFDDDWK